MEERIRRRSRTGRTVLLLLLFLSPAFLSIAAETTPQTVRPTGEYRVVHLELNEGLRIDVDEDERTPQVVHLAFRKEELSNWWIIDHGWHATQKHQKSVELGDKGIQGTLSLRLYHEKGSLLNTAKLSFDLRQSNETFEGAIHIELTDKDGQPIQTWDTKASGSFLQATTAFDPKAQWSNFAGPMGTLQAAKGGPALVDDLANSQPQWRSEAQIPVSYGNAADDRYATRAAACRSGGGSSSPVYADGAVYIAYYVPNRSVPTDWSKEHESRREMYTGKGLQNLIAEKGYNEVEIRAIEDHWLPLADEVMVAMDARTGETLWQTTWPLRAYNLQTHKHRGTFGVPLIASGKVFYPSFNNSLQVMDAETGKALWEFPKFEKPPETKYWPKGPPSQSPLLIEDTVVWSIGETTFGLAAADGKILWENKSERFNHHSLREVTLNSSRFVLVAAHHHGKPSLIRLIDPGNGSTLWTEEVGNLGTYEAQFANLLAISGDKLVAFCYKTPPPHPQTGKIDKEKITDHIHAWRLTESEMKHLWEDGDLPPDEGPHLAIANGIVYGVGKHLVRCLDLESGKVLGEIAEKDFPHPEGQLGDVPRSNPLLIVAGKNTVLLTFNKKVDPKSAQTASNYTSAVPIRSATLTGDGQTVVLETPDLKPGSDYEVAVKNVIDTSAEPNRIDEGAALDVGYRVAFRYFRFTLTEKGGLNARLNELRLLVGEKSYGEDAKASGTADKAGNLFDNQRNTYGHFALDEHVTFDLGAGSAIAPDAIEFEVTTATRFVLGYLLEGSNDGTTWTKLAEHSGEKLTETVKHPIKIASLDAKKILKAKSVQAIEFPTPLEAASGIRLTASATSGLPVNYAVIEGPGKVSEDHLVPTGEGKVRVRAMQGGSENYYSAMPVEQILEVSTKD